jgi:conjugative relaxase-like TrwC/TraI family protein
VVLSIGKLVQGQHQYYERQVAQGGDDYYSGRGEAPGYWTGRGAARLSLSGEVSGDQFTALLAGAHPGDPSVRLRSTARDPHVLALDLTFSAPKSISVLFGAADEATASALVEAHEAAVAAALSYIEERAVFVRRGHGGRRFEAAGGLVAAAYRHRMSRALDPQLHTHVVAANLAEGRDGRWTALHHPSLFAVAKTAGYLYQAHLRQGVRERLGLSWGPVRKGAGELEAIPRAVLEEFSRRRHAMRRAAEAGGIGLSSKAAAQAAALATRQRKEYGLCTHTWREEVRARASEHGLDQPAIERLLVRGRARRDEPAPGIDERAVGDRLAGPAGLTERENTFGAGEVLQAFAAAAEQGATVPEVRVMAARFAARADVLRLPGRELSTADLVACERRLLSTAAGRAGEGCGVLDARKVHRALARGERVLTEQQTQALTGAVSRGHGVEVILALAGTGKTYVAGALGEVYRQAGYEVLGVAPTARAARELAEQADVGARTLDRRLLELTDTPLPARCVVLFDEAGMAATRPTERLLAACQQAGAKVIAIGDPGQLPSVQAGGWLGALAQELGPLRLREVHRQRDHGERRALAALHEGRGELYVRWGEQAGRLHLCEQPAEAITAAIAAFEKACLEHGPQEAVLITRSNHTRQALNQDVRERRRERGELGEERLYGAMRVAVGERVICRCNAPGLDVDNGTRGTVRRVDPHDIVLHTDSGVYRTLPAGYVAEHLQHAYALTSHGMQGANVQWAAVIAAPHDMSRGWAYTALSRARTETHLYLQPSPRIHHQQREEHAPTARPQTPTREQTLDALARRMRRRDEQDLAITKLARARPDEAGDRDLVPVLPHQERAAEHAEPLTPAAASRAELAALDRQLQRLRAQQSALPLAELRGLDALGHARERLACQREQLAQRFAVVPAPARRLLRRDHDPHAVERARLHAAIAAADQQIESLDEREDRTRRQLGDPAQIGADHERLQARVAELQSEREHVLDTLVQRELQNSGPWLQNALGAEPAHPRGGDHWRGAARQLARYRAEHGITDPRDPLGPRPENPDQHHQWRHTQEQLHHVQRRLGLPDIARERGRGC